MLKSIEAKGDSIDAAVESALQQLGMSRDDVSVEVLQTPKSGFFGLGREPAIVSVSYQASPAGKAKRFLEGLLVRFGTPAELRITEDFDQNNIHIELIGSNMGAIIGRRGETLDAIQYLTSLVTNRDEEDHWRVTLDTEGYREKREASLQELAKRTAQKAMKYKKPVALDPMNPQERRIIHACLQDYGGIMTYSIGSEPNRKVVIAPEGSAPVGGGQPKKQGGNPRRRRRGGQGRPPVSKQAGSSSQE